MNDFNYKELLKHPKWQKKRLEILERDDFQCQLCDDKETTLHIHHLKYEYGNKPWEYNKVDLLTVCKDCHTLIHTHGKNNDPLELKGIKVMKDKEDDSILFGIIESGCDLKMTVIHENDISNSNIYTFIKS